MYRSIRSFSIPPPGIPRAFDTFADTGRREFDYQSLPGGGEFDTHALGVGNLNCTLDFMWHVSVLWATLADALWNDFKEKDCGFAANWPRSKGLHKICAVFEGI